MRNLINETESEMKALIGIVLLLVACVFGFVGFEALTHAKSAVHQIQAFMMMGFSGLFVGQIGIMAK